MGKKNNLGEQELLQFIKAVDTSGDGKIQREELFEILIESYQSLS